MKSRYIKFSTSIATNTYSDTDVSGAIKCVGAHMYSFELHGYPIYVSVCVQNILSQLQSWEQSCSKLVVLFVASNV